MFPELATTSHQVLLELYPTYCIVTMTALKKLSMEILDEVRGHHKRFYQNNPFIVINVRGAELATSPLFFKSSLPNIKGFAVVCTSDAVIPILEAEQAEFDFPYAFFHEIDEAKAWAATIFS